jgi:hypothetical protein
VLGPTDDNREDAYLDWLRPIRPLGVARRATARVFMLSLKGQWIEATAVGHPDGPIGVKVEIERSMSGRQSSMTKARVGSDLSRLHTHRADASSRPAEVVSLLAPEAQIARD